MENAENMKHQINLLSQLQEMVLTRDERHHAGDYEHLDTLNESIDALVGKLEPPIKVSYQRLYKKDHLVMSPMVDGCCGVCGMRLPVSQVQQVRLARAVQTCASCGRMLYDEEQDAPRVIAEKPARGEPRKTGISRFSAEELMVCDLKGDTTEAVIRELAEAMEANRFVSNADALVTAAMERETVFSRRWATVSRSRTCGAWRAAGSRSRWASRRRASPTTTPARRCTSCSLARSPWR